MATPQENLDAAYPGAVNGDAVLDETSRDYWLKQGGVWKNVGPQLGDAVEILYDVIPYTETLLIELVSKTRLKAYSYPYSLSTTLTTASLLVKTLLLIKTVTKVEIPVSIISLEYYAPSRQIGDVYVFPITSAIAVIPYTPQEIISSLTLPGPGVIAITAYAPSTQATILVENPAGILVVCAAPDVVNVPSPGVTSISIQAFEPLNIGGFLELNSATVSITANVPSIERTMPVTNISMFLFLPDIQTAIQVPSPVFVQIIAVPPDDGSGIIVTTTNLSIVAISPAIDAYPIIDPTALYGRYVIKWDQPEDTYQTAPGFSTTDQIDVDLDSIVGYYRVVNILTPSGTTPIDGERSTAVVRAGSKYSGRFYLSGTTNNPRLSMVDPCLNPPERPWIQSNMDATLFTPFSGITWRDPVTLASSTITNEQDFVLELWVYPLGESFTGTTEANARPLMCNNHWDGTTYYRGWDLHFRGTGGVGTVYIRANNENYSTNPIAVAVTAQSTNNFTANAWNHVLWMRKNNQIGIAVNGVWGTIVNYSGFIGSIAIVDTVQTGISTSLFFFKTHIGAFRESGITSTAIPGESNRFSGYIDSIRFQKGLTPSYTFTNFTPPSGQFPYGIRKRVENNITYYTTTTFYEQDMWLWWWENQVTYDAQAMEEGIKLAVNRFIIGCKKDEIWQCFTDCYLFIGPRTLNGILNIALRGADPNEWHVDSGSSTNFVQSDYNRKTGLKGDGVSKWIRTPRVNNIFSQNNHHRAAWVTEVGTGPIFAGGVNQAGSTYVDWIPGYGGVRHGFVTNVKTISGNDALTSSGGFIGFSRSSASSYNYIVPGASGTVNEASQSPWMEPVEILGASIDQVNNYSTVSKGSHRIAFYSHGSSVDLEKLKRRVTLLMTEIQAAIP